MNMKRYALDSLKNWKNSPNRRPLLLFGARQVGKTWLVRDFAAADYTDFIELNFFNNDSLKDIFNTDISPKHIINQLEIQFNRNIDPAKTLLFFDEIQESQKAMDSLKTFNDLAPEYNLIAAGSFLGVMMGQKPVGQTDQLTLFPMSFYEFLEAAGREKVVNAIRERDVTTLIGLSGLLVDLLKQYFFVGGMPAAVLEYITSGDLNKVREIQTNLLVDYKGDFSRHVGLHDIPKVSMLWDSIPLHLVKEKKKFVYKEIKTGARAAEFENAMQWLVDTGLVYKINRVDNPQIPLIANQSFGIFKLYMLDIGLFGAKAEISPRDIFTPNVDITGNFNGALAEQFVCQELKSAKVSSLFYWGREKSQAELDFLIQNEGEIIPIEVKSTRHTKAKSLYVYMNEYKPEHAIRTSLKNYGIEGNLYSLPLYMISDLLTITKKHPVF
jgi:predicted AAA+ superfamily ATPase